MAAPAPKDYGKTVDPATYVSGIRNHIWLGAMYARKDARVLAEVERLYRLGFGTSYKQAYKQLHIYDVGCGPAHSTTTLAESVSEYFYRRNKLQGVDIVGIDASRIFIDYAEKRRKIPRALPPILRFLNEDVRTIGTALPPAQIITTTGFFHHFTPAEKPEVMRKVAELIEPGGILVDGDEHVPLREHFEAWYPGHGRYLSLCALYFQVIAAADSIRDADLVSAETENFLAEAFRGQSEEYIPRSAPDTIVRAVVSCAHEFMTRLYRDGLHGACMSAFALTTWLKCETRGFGHAATFTDRGDFKDTLPEFVAAIGAAGLKHESTYDPGNCNLLGSAPVTVFRKPL